MSVPDRLATHIVEAVLPALADHERLVLARRSRRLSQGELAPRAQVDLSRISRIERGVKPSLSVEVLGRLAAALETSPNDLLGWDERQSPPPAPQPPAQRPRPRKAAPAS
jgi:transcriptional regulator with XRE-family HTH domain